MHQSWSWSWRGLCLFIASTWKEDPRWGDITMIWKNFQIRPFTILKDQHIDLFHRFLNLWLFDVSIICAFFLCYFWFLVIPITQSHNPILSGFFNLKNCVWWLELHVKMIWKSFPAIRKLFFLTLKKCCWSVKLSLCQQEYELKLNGHNGSDLTSSRFGISCQFAKMKTEIFGDVGIAGRRLSSSFHKCEWRTFAESLSADDINIFVAKYCLIRNAPRVLSAGRYTRSWGIISV
jgi:hypothetical protein